jgi:membrane-bound lytic murein transglycosylase B
LLIGIAGAAGAVLIPATAPARQPVAEATDGPTMSPTSPTVGPALTAPPTVGGTVPPGAGPVVPGRPAEVLAGWAEQTGRRTGVPAVAMQAYGYAELVLAQTKPACRLSWTTLAAIGYVESTHGSANGAVLGPDGVSSPPIIGQPLDGNGGRQRITDTDAGAYDQDTTYDRAVGPMQFIPSTWKENGVDADNDGAPNPQNINDAALTAGYYLCKNDRDLSTAEDWWNAILSYNDVRPYAQAVFDMANQYGTSSQSAA